MVKYFSFHNYSLAFKINFNVKRQGHSVTHPIFVLSFPFCLFFSCSSKKQPTPNYGVKYMNGFQTNIKSWNTNNSGVSVRNMDVSSTPQIRESIINHHHHLCRCHGKEAQLGAKIYIDSPSLVICWCHEKKKNNNNNTLLKQTRLPPIYWFFLHGCKIFT